MSRIFLFLAAFALLGFFIMRSFSDPTTMQPFVEGCLSGGGSPQQCECLGAYVHKHLDDKEVVAILENRVVSQTFQDKIAEVVKTGTAHCR